MCNCKVCRFIRETEVLLCYSLVEITTKVVMFHKPEPLSDGRKLALGSKLDGQTAITEIQARITVEGAIKRWAKALLRERAVKRWAKKALRSSFWKSPGLR